MITLAAVAAGAVAGVGIGQGAAQAAPACQPYGEIGSTWHGAGGNKSYLGHCVDDEHAVPGGRAQGFAGGAVYWSDKSGAHSVKGLIREHYYNMGASGSFLGFPLNDEWGTAKHTGSFNHFQGGSIYWSHATGAHEVHGAIRDRWKSMGWETGALGYPTSDEYKVSEGKRSDFQGGSIIWNAKTGATRVIGNAAAAVAPAAHTTSAPSSAGQKALAVAATKLGAPYVWGANGPSTFDCSGLTSWAFRQIGINIPRTAAQQATVGSHVAKGDLKAGDLVFFYSPVSHVGIYDGKGNVLNAPTAGQGVKYTPIQYLEYNTARRI
ncbi:NlpC/P60 family protein [Rhodococcus sp. X156]|uniref:NlpC/P60 family protein n=1 Tax=Rhodococcus sp. X156 TaxID=2499145 RepID=UPI0013E398F0|nr:NlpC/P60 family protein [Rhodococcus sp. X156]